MYFKSELLWAARWIVLVFFPLACTQQEEIVTLPFYNTPDFTPEWIYENDIKYNSIHQITEFEFTNQHGEAISNETFDGKIYVADFFFTTCPGICPEMTNNLLTIQEFFQSDKEIMILSHSVTPWVDSVARLEIYAELNGIDAKKWHLVTGDKDKIYEIARKYYFAEKSEGYDKSPEAFVHTENFLLIDYQRRIRGIYNGTLAVEMERLIADINTLKKELAVVKSM